MPKAKATATVANLYKTAGTSLISLIQRLCINAAVLYVADLFGRKFPDDGALVKQRHDQT